MQRYERQYKPNGVANIKNKTIKENEFFKNLNFQIKSHSIKEKIC